MEYRNKSCLFAVLFCLIPAIPFAGNPAPTPSKACREKELFGEWGLTKLDVMQRGWPFGGGPQTFKYQKKIFYKDGKIHQLVSDVPITPEIEKKLVQTPPVEFTVDPNGWVIVRSIKKAELDRYKCSKLSPDRIQLAWMHEGRPILTQTLDRIGLKRAEKTRELK